MPCPFCQSQNHTLTRCDSHNLVVLCQTAYDKFTTEFIADRENGTNTMGTWLNTLDIFEIRGLTAKYKLQLNWCVLIQRKTIIYLHSLILRNMFQENITINEFDNFANQLKTGKINRDIIHEVKRKKNEIYILEKMKQEWRDQINNSDDLRIIDFYIFLRRTNQIESLEIITSLSNRYRFRDIIRDISVTRYDLLFRQFLETRITNPRQERLTNPRQQRLTNPRQQRLTNPRQQRLNINIKLGIDIETYLEECPLCYEVMSFEKNIRTNCSHEFCVNCIKRYLPTGRTTCPMCRGQITEMVCHSAASFNDICPFVNA
jgi:hypothetical protein